MEQILNKNFEKVKDTMIKINSDVDIKIIEKPCKLDIPSFYQVFFTYLKNNNERYNNQISTIIAYLKINNFFFNSELIFTKKPALKQLQKLYYYIEDNFNELKNNFLYSILNQENFNNIPSQHNFLYNTFITFDSFEKIKKQIKFENIIEYNIENIKGKIIIFTKNNKLDIISAREIVNRFLFLNYYTENYKLPKFIIYASDLKKKLVFDNTNNKIIRENNVNTAATDTLSKIIIWRKEELMKSIFHESIHFHGLDIITNSQKIKLYLHQHLNIAENTKILIREGYTEFLTNILNILYIIRNNYNYNTFIKYLNKEKQFSIKQIANILTYFNYKSFADFLKQNTNIFSRNPIPFKQNTSVISYYIIKSLFLFNFEIIFHNNIINNNLLKYNNQSDDILMEIISSNINKKDYKEIKSNKTKNKWIKEINQKMNRLNKTSKKIKKNTKKKSIKTISMKMTYFS